MNKTSSFGKLVKERRTQLDLTQAELARRVGCATITIRKIEADTLRPSVQISERLAMSLKIPLEDRANFVRLARTATLKDPTPPPLPTPPLQPSEIGLDDLSGRAVRSYELAERIGEGGFGAVYRALQVQIEREVAIKIILPKYANHPEFIRRFEAEAKTVARLEHPHIVPLYDYWREPSAAYLVMRLMRGDSLYDALQNGALPTNDAIGILDQIGSALHAAHRMGVIHRDIKPANILLDEDRNAYLSDFGIAKNMNMEDQTQDGQLIGSPAYLSPEQILAEPIRPQTDIYCLGILFYEMLTAHKPFAGPTPVAYLQQHLNDSLPPLAKYNSNLPPALDDVIAKATAKSPADRYEDVVQMITAVNEANNASIHLSEGNAIGNGRSPLIDLSTQDWADLENPYKGLHAFGEADVDRFYGRETLIQELLGQLTGENELSRFLAVVGPSGSGKSSVVKAGLVPALRRGGLPGSENWYVVDFTPGAHPWEEVEAALLRIAVNPPQSLLAQLQEGSRGLLRAINRILPDDGESKLVMVIDQFEELFTLVADEAVREQFLDSLVQATLDERSRLHLVITLRADFYDRPLQYVDFGDLLRQRTVSVLPMTPDELEQAITQPVAQLGVMLEEGLLPNIMQDVADQPGGLPLLQYALTELFERRERHLMTRAVYQEIGEVTGALAKRADEIYEGLDAGQQEATRQMFLRLVTLGEGVEDTRRRVLQSELMQLANNQQLTGNRERGTGNNHSALSTQHSAILHNLEVYGRHRLLTFDNDPNTREPTVEVAHEALLREWERLHDWLAESRNDVRRQRLLANGAREWETAVQDPSYLLRGARLSQFEGWAAETTMALTSNESAFLQASIVAREEQQMAEEARHQRELETAQQLAATEHQRAEEQVAAAQNLRRRAMYLGLALVVAVVLAGVAVFAGLQAVDSADTAVANANSAATAEANAENERILAQENEAVAIVAQAEAATQANLAATAEAVAEEERALAQENESEAVAAQEEAIAQAEIARFNEAQAQSQALTTSAREARTSGDIALALALAIQAVDIDQPPVEAVRTLNDLAYAPGTYLTYEIEGEDNPAEDFFVNNVAFLRWDPILDEDEPLVTVDGAGFVTLWDANSGEMLNQFRVGGNPLVNPDDQNRFILNGALIPDSTLLILGVGNESNEVTIWDWSTGEKVQTLPGLEITRTEFGQAFAGPDGESVIAMSWLGGPDTEVDGVRSGFQFVAWDIESGAQIYTIEGARGERILKADVTPDNKFAVIPVWEVNEQTQRQYKDGSGSRLLIVDLATGEITEAAQSELDGNIVIHDVAINAAGDQAFMTITDRDDGFKKTGVFISLPSGEVEATMPLKEGGNFAVFSPDGTQIVVTGGASSTFFTLYDTTTGELIRQLGSNNEGHNGYISDRAIAFTPDGKRLVSADSGGNVLLWDVETGDLTEKLLGHPGSRFFALQMSPDGETVITGNVGKLHFWDISQDGAAQIFETHSAQIILDVVISPDGTKAISSGFQSPDGSGDEAILWDTSTFEVIRRLPGIYKTAKFLPDGSVILGGIVDFASGESRLVRWDIESGEVIGEKNTGLLEFLSDLDVSPDGNSILFVTNASNIYQYDLESLTEMKTFSIGDNRSQLQSVAFSPDGRTFLVGSAFGFIAAMNLDTSEEIQRYVQGGAMIGLAVSKDGERFVSASGDNTLILWDVASGEVIRTFKGHSDAATSVVFTPDERQIISSSADGTLILWDVASGEALRTFNEHDAWVNKVALSPDGQLAYSAADDGKVIVRPIAEIPVDELLDYIAENRVLRDFSCEEREQYRIQPLCDAD